MGRKKRKVDSISEVGDEDPEIATENSDVTTNDNSNQTVRLNEPTHDILKNDAVSGTVQETISQKNESGVKIDENSKKITSSSYVISSHSGELIQEDIYVSDGSLDSDDDDEIEIVLTSSRMGIMRRGLHHQMMALQQPNRQWKRQDAINSTDAQATENIGEDNEMTTEEAEELKRKREEEELAQLDPAQRAARLLLEKQRREAEAKIEERRLENEENVMRDPTLFSKRTAFDIRFDQIDDKPWQRGIGSSDNHSEFFNYGLSEEDWMEYAAQQLIIRQELIDAFRQKRAPDPVIVPIQPRVRAKEISEAVPVTAPTPNDIDSRDNMPINTAIVSDSQGIDNRGIVKSIVTSEETTSVDPSDKKVSELIEPKRLEIEDISIGIGGAWGAGATPGSFLARLLEEQENNDSVNVKSSNLKDEITVTQSENTFREDNNSDQYHETTNEKLDQNNGRSSQRGRGEDGDSQPYHENAVAKPDRSYGRSSRRGSGGDAVNHDADDSHLNDGYDYRGGEHWNRPVPPPPPPHGWFPPPPPSQHMDSYNSYPPAYGPGYHGGGRGRGGRSGGRFPPRGGARGGRGYYNRESSGWDEPSQESQQGGWKRPRNDDEPRRRY